jgi:hypothetical protein
MFVGRHPTARARLAVALAMITSLVTSCSGKTTTPVAGVLGEDSDPAVVHVHGMEVDPTSKTLYVATHTGLFTVSDDGEVQRVGDHYHDLMGFTIAGEGDFIASGHPDLRATDLQKQGAPPLLGLVESTDGRSWKSISLLGEVDFHSLEAKHGKVYGFDSTGGRFMVSEDRVDWETHSQITLSDFAVSPVDPELVVGASARGVARSTDQGRSWQHVNSLPVMVLEWTEQGPMAATVDGALLISDEQGEDWRRVGSLDGQPEALEARDGTLYAAIAERGVLRSTNGGASWQVMLDHRR